MEENPLSSLEKEWRRAVQDAYGSMITFGLMPWDDPDIDIEANPPLAEGDVLVELIDWAVEGDDVVLPVPEAVDMVMAGLKRARPDLNFVLFPQLKPRPPGV